MICRNCILLLVASCSMLCLTACKSTPAASSDTSPSQSSQETPMNYPDTRREEIVETLHGVRVADPYRWLEEVKSDEVKSWMATQQAFTDEYLKKLEGRTWLTKRFTELYYIDAMGTPRRHGDRFFLYRRKAGEEKYVLYWKEGIDGEEKLLIDPNALSEDGSTSLGDIYPSRDGKFMAYQLNVNNADEATMYVMEVETGKISEIDVIEGAKYAWPSWLPDNSGFYYTWLPVDDTISAMDRPGFAEVRLHKLGESPAKDVQIMGRTGNPQMFLGAEVTRDGKHLFVFKQKGWSETNVYYQEVGADRNTWATLAEGLDATFSMTDLGDDLFITTNWKAPNMRVLRTSVKSPSLETAVEVVPERQDAVLEGMQIVGGKMVLNYLENAYNKLYLHDLAGKKIREIALPAIGATSNVIGEPDRPEAYFTFTSFTVPNQIYQTNVESGEMSLWAKIDVPIDPTKYKVEQVRYPSKDGTEVTMFIVTRKDIKLDSTTPFMLYGYGGFNVNMTPGFRSSIYPWLEMGGGYAVANLRGGGEYGEAWHKAGMLLNKQNVFDDFHAAAEYLIRNKYTRPEKLAIRGGSNGGLLVGAAMTQRPELYGAVICAVPLLDMVRYHLHGSGKTWIPEYGSADDEAQFKALYGYSPYHHINKGVDYPPALFMSADSDDRVDPLHARKMVAALQAADADGEPLLLRIEENAGHGGGDMVKKWVESDVDTYAFLMKQLGMSAPK